MKSFAAIVGLIFAITINTGCNPDNVDAATVPGETDTLTDTGADLSDSLNFTEITCPHCGFKKTEELPTDVCQIAYTCTNCAEVLHPKKGDCCVYCSYGTHKCPSMQ